nr:hypothetical protein [Tanacetum cinerariifolium]
MQSYRVGHFAESYQAFEKSANAFTQEFRNWESAWALEALYAVVYEIRILAERAERELASNGKTPEKLKAAGSFLMKVFGVLAVRKRTKTCWSAICHLPIEEFPVRDKLTYMYYAGRLEVLNENYPAADHKLSYALTHCDPRSKANIRYFLTMLQYSDIVLAMRRGDHRLLRHALEEHEDRHVSILLLV